MLNRGKTGLFQEVLNMTEEEKYTKTMDGEYMLDGEGNKIPLSHWVNDPDDDEAAKAEAVSDAEVEADIKRLENFLNS